MDPALLPVNRHRDRILDALESNQVVVIESPTGSGKTTQLPIILHEAGYHQRGIIGITQPRRIAAVSVSEYIAKQTSSTIPGLVGYKMRFHDMTDATTRIKVMTDGILLQELKADPFLSSYGTIIVDEAHERSLNIDFVLGLLKRILRERSDFRILVSSATINAEVFSEYFDGCPVVRIDAEAFPVRTIYHSIADDPSEEEILDRITRLVEQIEAEGDRGDVLVFLAGEFQIKSCIALLASSSVGRSLHLLPLYGRLSKEEQDRVFDPAPEGLRKVVVATNIAETSITIDGIRWVIDSGLAKINNYNPKTFTAALVETPISRASCNQRRGRAGRTAAGVCYRLYSRKSFQNRPLYTTEEIYRTDLSEVVLRMSELGIYDFDTFDFISRPSRSDIRGAVETLECLDAIESDRSLSEIGRMMAEFPLLPRQSRIIVDAIYRHPAVVAEAIIAASFLSANSPFLLPHGEEIEARRKHHRFRSDDGDFVSFVLLLNAYRSATRQEHFCRLHYLDYRVMAEIDNIVVQLGEIVSSMGVPIGSGGSTKEYLCSVAAGLVQFVCERDGKRAYRSSTAERINIHPGSVMFQKNPDYIVAGEIVQTTRMFARSVSPLERSWLAYISPFLKRAFLPEARAARSPKAAREDKTRQVEIGSRLFQVVTGKGNKPVVELPWEELRPLLGVAGITGKLPGKSMRATVIYREHELFAAYRIGKIFSLLAFIDPERDFIATAPDGKEMRLPADRDALMQSLDEIGKIAPLGKGRKTGFVTLQTDGERFWKRSHRALSHSTSESLASLETLADILSGDEELERRANEAYRRVNELLDR